MPYTSVKEAKEAKFPTSVDGISLTLDQINRLAELYDAMEESENADEPMAVAIAQWKKEHKKSDDAWIIAELFGAEVPPSSFDPATHIVNAIKVGTVAHTSLGHLFECTAEWMQVHAEDWTGGNLIANHYGTGTESYGTIVRSWWDNPFIKMELGDMNPEAERRMNASEHTGFSFDATGDPEAPADVSGTNLSILFYPHAPACSSKDGCGIVDTGVAAHFSNPKDRKIPESQSQSVKLKDIQKHISGSEYMGEGKPYTEDEIAKLVSDSAKLATFEAEAKTNGATVRSLEAEIEARNDKISELTDGAGKMFTAEEVETQVEDAKKTMFSAEDVEAAKEEAIKIAIDAEKEKVDNIAAEIAVVNQMFPDGLAEDFHAEIVTLIKDGKSHEAFVKLGDVDFKHFKANISTGAKGAPPDEIVASNGVGVYDPITGTYDNGGK